MKGLGISLKIIEGTKNYISVEFIFFEEVAYLRCDVLVSQSCLTLATLWTVAFQPPVYGILQYSGKNTGVGSHSLLQRIFLTQGLNLDLCIAGRFFTIWATREARNWGVMTYKYVQEMR